MSQCVCACVCECVLWLCQMWRNFLITHWAAQSLFLDTHTHSGRSKCDLYCGQHDLSDVFRCFRHSPSLNYCLLFCVRLKGSYLQSLRHIRDHAQRDERGAGSLWSLRISHTDTKLRRHGSENQKWKRKASLGATSASCLLTPCYIKVAALSLEVGLPKEHIFMRKKKKIFSQAHRHNKVWSLTPQ